MVATQFSELDLDPRLLAALKDKGYKRPTAIQSEAIPAAMEGRDVMGSAPTGTGKTAAFLLPAIQHLLDYPRKKPGAPRVLVLTPTRELAMQVADQARELAANTHLAIATITGGVAYLNHAEVFSKNQDIVVATPGRLLQYIKEENFDCRAVEILIFDEADRMLQMGFGQDAEKISAETRWRNQTFLFSATLEGDALQNFADRLLNDPVKIEAEPSRRERKKILQFYYRADNLEHKTALLAHLLKQDDVTRAIVFVRKRERVRELVDNLHRQGIIAGYLEGEMAQTQRTRAIDKLKNGDIKVLVATDVASRGIDIDDISHVFNFDLPRTADAYLHRIGRTGRIGRKGTAISLVEAHDFDLLGKITRYINEELKYRVVDELRPQTKAPKHEGRKGPSKKQKERQKKKRAEKLEQKTEEKTKIRVRDKKNIGKRRQASSEENVAAKQKLEAAARAERKRALAAQRAAEDEYDD
ncbi:ATP-dependent RNA helicase SrmB [Plesiomonas shigelloides]|uniref:ATP-dependent RNA helicase SrmB n=1 Tax=Plesiomonas shigelloides TaxID=703 RepID=UPI0012623D12|nr:ATP-dependent RNA helicase SrmB [Plesiomonas shigelloides]KAB7698252.1 ATP-dependent RNA helicase SrmB [Plesiomonas shigelloides]